MLARRLERGADELDLERGRRRARRSLEMQQAVESVHVSEPIRLYMVDLVAATREARASRSARARAARSRCSSSRAAGAALAGRDFVVPDDVKAVAVPALAHRLTLRPELWVQRRARRDVVREVLETVPTPPAEERGRTVTRSALPKLRAYPALAAAALSRRVVLGRPELVVARGAVRAVPRGRPGAAARAPTSTLERRARPRTRPSRATRSSSRSSSQPTRGVERLELRADPRPTPRAGRAAATVVPARARSGRSTVASFARRATGRTASAACEVRAFDGFGLVVDARTIEATLPLRVYPRRRAARAGCWSRAETQPYAGQPGGAGEGRRDRVRRPPPVRAGRPRPPHQLARERAPAGAPGQREPPGAERRRRALPRHIRRGPKRRRRHARSRRPRRRRHWLTDTSPARDRVGVVGFGGVVRWLAPSIGRVAAPPDRRDADRDRDRILVRVEARRRPAAADTAAAVARTGALAAPRRPRPRRARSTPGPRLRPGDRRRLAVRRRRAAPERGRRARVQALASVARAPSTTGTGGSAIPVVEWREGIDIVTALEEVRSYRRHARTLAADRGRRGGRARGRADRRVPAAACRARSGRPCARAPPSRSCSSCSRSPGSSGLLPWSLGLLGAGFVLVDAARSEPVLAAPVVGAGLLLVAELAYASRELARGTGGARSSPRGPSRPGLGRRSRRRHGAGGRDRVRAAVGSVCLTPRARRVRGAPRAARAPTEGSRAITRLGP